MALSMSRWKGKVAIVTGVSAGIGAATAERLVNEGLQVVGLARRKENVEKLATKLQNKPGKLHALKTDVTKESDILDAFTWTKRNLGPVHILINNAGIGRNTNLINGDTKLWREIVDTNVMAVCIGTREAVRDMRANNVDGHIIHINSIAGHFTLNYAGMNVYPASKHAVTVLTEILRQELASINSKIKITSISPGAVRTEILEASGLAHNKKLVEYWKTGQILNSEDVTDSIIYALSTPPHVQVHELIIRPVGEKF